MAEPREWGGGSGACRARAAETANPRKRRWKFRGRDAFERGVLAARCACLGDSLTDRALLRAVHKLDVAGVAALLEKGPSPHALWGAIEIVHEMRGSHEHIYGRKSPWERDNALERIDAVSAAVMQRYREIREGGGI